MLHGKLYSQMMVTVVKICWVFIRHRTFYIRKINCIPENFMKCEFMFQFSSEETGSLGTC